MSGTAPKRALQDLAFLGAACLSLDTACRPLMNFADADVMDTIVGRLKAIEWSISGVPHAGTDNLAKEHIHKAVGLRSVALGQKRPDT